MEVDGYEIDAADVDWQETARSLQAEVTRLTEELTTAREEHQAARNNGRRAVQRLRKERDRLQEHLTRTQVERNTLRDGVGALADMMHLVYTQSRSALLRDMVRCLEESARLIIAPTDPAPPTGDLWAWARVGDGGLWEKPPEVSP